MSFAALAWAAKQRPGNLAAKMVLLGLANYADEHGCSFPSTAALAEFGDMDHKTATVALDRLAALGLVVDSGERAGRTKQIKVYRLALESLPKAEASQKRKPSVSPPKDPQKRGTDTIRDTIPKKDKPSLDTRGTKLPSGLTLKMTDEMVTITTGWPPGKLESEMAQFCDHHTAKGTTSKDWQASLRTWMRNAEKWRPKHGRQQPDNLRGSRPDPSLDMFRQANAELHAKRGDSPPDFGPRPALPSFRPG